MTPSPPSPPSPQRSIVRITYKEHDVGNTQENEIISFKSYEFLEKNDRIRKKKTLKLIQLIHLVYLYEDERDILSGAVKCLWNWPLKTSNWIEVRMVGQ